jgi:hypothetical protein
MSVSEDFQQFEQKAGLDRHVIPTGFLGGGGRVFYRHVIPTEFLIAEFERNYF